MENNKEASQKVYVYDRLEVYVYELEDYWRRRRKIVVLDGAQHKVEDPPSPPRFGQTTTLGCGNFFFLRIPSYGNIIEQFQN